MCAGALNNGVTPEELQEIFLHASVYLRLPRRAGRLPHRGRSRRGESKATLRGVAESERCAKL
jgi:hypothetical protein